MYNMASKMARTGKSPAQIFSLLDTDGGGSLDHKEFTEGLQKKLNLMFSEEECEELVQFIDADNSGDIDLKEFVSKIGGLIYKSWPKD